MSMTFQSPRMSRQSAAREHSHWPEYHSRSAESSPRTSGFAMKRCIDYWRFADHGYAVHGAMFMSPNARLGESILPDMLDPSAPR